MKLRHWTHKRRELKSKENHQHCDKVCPFLCVCVNCAFIMQTEWTLLFIKWPEMQRLLSCKATQTYCPYSNALACISPTPPLHRSESTKPLQTAVTIPSEFLLSDLQSKHNKTFLKSLLLLYLFLRNVLIL